MSSRQTSVLVVRQQISLVEFIHHSWLDNYDLRVGRQHGLQLTFQCFCFTENGEFCFTYADGIYILDIVLIKPNAECFRQKVTILTTMNKPRK